MSKDTRNIVFVRSLKTRYTFLGIVSNYSFAFSKPIGSINEFVKVDRKHFHHPVICGPT